MTERLDQHGLAHTFPSIGVFENVKLCCFDRLLGLAFCLRLRLGLGFLLCRPSLAHSFSSRLSLNGSEFSTFFLCWFRSGGSYSGQRILWWSSPALRRPLEGLDCSIQLVSLCN